MLRKRIAAVAGGLLLVLVGAGVPSAMAATPAANHSAEAVTLHYDASGSAEFSDAVKAAVNNWNTAVHNVQLAPAGSGEAAEVTIVATDGWPQATLGPVRPGGQGTVEMGRQATQEGHDPTRIAAHELGHILGLPDHYEGPCSEIMSGHGPGTSCKNATPDANEAAAVEQNYASNTFHQPVTGPVIMVDAAYGRESR